MTAQVIGIKSSSSLSEFCKWLKKVRNFGNQAKTTQARVVPPNAAASRRLSRTMIKAAAIHSGSSDDTKGNIQKPAESEALSLVFTCWWYLLSVAGSSSHPVSDGMLFWVGVGRWGDESSRHIWSTATPRLPLLLYLGR